MIIDRIEHFEQYRRCIPEIGEVMRFLQRVRSENLPAGKYPLHSGFVLIQEGTTHSFDAADFEVHHKYIDLQILLSGSEYLEYADKRDLKTVRPFDAEKDLELMSGEGSKLLIKPNNFYILYPGDGHKPCCHETTPTVYKKIVAKIKIDKLVHRVDWGVIGGTRW